MRQPAMLCTILLVSASALGAQSAPNCQRNWPEAQRASPRASLVTGFADYARDLCVVADRRQESNQDRFVALSIASLLIGAGGTLVSLLLTRERTKKTVPQVTSAVAGVVAGVLSLGNYQEKAQQYERCQWVVSRSIAALHAQYPDLGSITPADTAAVTQLRLKLNQDVSDGCPGL